jgi:hypothetical protein
MAFGLEFRRELSTPVQHIRNMKELQVEVIRYVLSSRTRQDLHGPVTTCCGIARPATTHWGIIASALGEVLGLAILYFVSMLSCLGASRMV